MVPAATPRDIVRQLARGSGLSVLIKVTNAVLAYAMLLAIARVTTAEQYGIFAVAFSVAVSTSYIATLGQPRAVTRFWPQWMGQNQPLKARAGLRRSMFLTSVGMGGAVALMVLGGALSLIVEMPWTFGVAAGTALFTLAFGWSEFTSAGLRAQGYIIAALAPRDIAWRAAVCALYGGAALTGVSFQAEAVILALGGILLVMVAPQIFMLVRSVMGAAPEHLPSQDRTHLSRYSVIMWAVTVADLARNYAGVIIVSSYLGAEAAGAYFAADRTASLLAFLLLAISLVSSPQISRYYHSGRPDLVRLIVGLSGLAAGSAALVGLVFFVFFGTKILALFNPAYVTFLPVLLILCCGQFFAAAMGPVGALLMLSGHERVNLVFVVGFGVLSVIAQVLGGAYWGPIGVAVGAAGGAIFTKLFAVVYALRTLGIDPTGLSLAVQWCRKPSRDAV